MKHLSVILLLLLGALDLSAEAVLVIKGSQRRNALVKESISGGGVFKRYKESYEYSTRPRRKFQTVKIVLAVTRNDEYTFSFGGGFTRSSGDRKNDFEWVDCAFLRVNGQELIGAKTMKKGEKFESILRPKAFKEKIKVSKGSKLTIELSFRTTPKKIAKKIENDKSLTPREKERLAKRAAYRAKIEAAAREREAQAKRVSEENQRVVSGRKGSQKADPKADSAEKGKKSSAADKGGKGSENDAPAEQESAADTEQ